ncbi:MAG: IS110 family transposase [Candidatus Brocadiia bacterium]
MVSVGIDWARTSAQHFVILTEDGQSVKEEGTFQRSVEGVNAFIERIRGHEPDPSNVRIGIDHKGGLVTTMLMAETFEVYGINPKSASRARDMFRPAGGKDDSIDAFVHAKMVHTGCHGAKALRPQVARDRQLLRLMRLRKSQVDSRSQQIQKLRNMLSERAPILQDLATCMDLRWVIDLLQQCPLDQDLCDWHGNSLNAFIKHHSMQGKTQKKIRRAAQREPMRYERQEAQTYRLQIRSLLEMVRSFTEQIQQLEERISDLHDDQAEREIFESLPTNSEMTITGLCLAFGKHRENAPSWRSYAAFYGVVPVTEESGEYREMRKRVAYDRVIHQCFINLADSSRQRDDCWASDYYQKKRNECKGHHHALRCLAQKWVKILHAMWRNRTLYDETFHASRRSQQRRAAA